MLTKVIALVCFAALSGVGVAYAQTDGPAELPSAEYAGQSYVDSKGCIFLKAGYGGEATWVPRVDKDRKLICGQTPTNAAAKVSDTAAAVVPKARKTRSSKRKAQADAPYVPVMIGCPASVPVARRYATTDGGSVVVCTATNGSLTGARSPIYPAGSGVGAALSATRHAEVTIPLPQQHGDVGALPSPPAGYELAWKDDRLNPLRGKGALERQAAQDTVSAGKAPTAQMATARLLSAPSGPYYVQVGTFAEPSNADGTTTRLMQMGMPVSKSKFSKQGRALQVIYAGPFVSGAAAQAALNVARGAGFSDAFIR